MTEYIAMLDVGHVLLNIMTKIPDWCIKTDRHYIPEILLKVAFSINKQTHFGLHIESLNTNVFSMLKPVI
jgi:hypothetical protein